METDMMKNVVIKPILTEKKRAMVGGGGSVVFQGSMTSKDIPINQFSIGLMAPPQP